MAEALLLSGDARGAARVYLDYCSDVDEAVAALAEGREWVEAARVARHSKRPDLLPTTVLPSLEEAAAASRADVEARRDRLQYIGVRLAAIREEEKERQRKVEEDADGRGGADVDDAASDWSRSHAPSASSKGSRASSHRTGSSRSSRSAKSGKTRSSARVPKEGDPWEEEYLLKTRADLVPTRALRQGLRRLLDALVVLDKVDTAAALQAAFAALENFVQEHGLGVLALEPSPPADPVWRLAFLDPPPGMKA